MYCQSVRGFFADVENKHKGVMKYEGVEEEEWGMVKLRSFVSILIY